MTTERKGTGKLVLTVIVAALMLSSVALAFAPALAGAVPARSPSAASTGALSTVPTAAGAAPPPPAPTEVFYTNPVVFAEDTATASFAWSSVSPYAAGTTVTFWLSTTTASTGIVGSSIGTTVLEAGSQNLANPVVLNVGTPTPGPGTYYILSNSVSAPTSYQLGPAVTVFATGPSILISPGTQAAGPIVVSGGGFDPGASLTFTATYPNLPGGNGFAAPATIVGTATATATGAVPRGTLIDMTYFSEIGNPYTIVAQETNAASVTFPLGGITADHNINLEATVATCQATGYPAFETCVSGQAPEGMISSISGALTSSFTLSGYGFSAGDTIHSVVVYGAYIGSATATIPVTPVTVSANGAFNITVSGLAAVLSANQFGGITVLTTPTGSIPTSFNDVIVISQPGAGTVHQLYPQIAVEDPYCGFGCGYIGDPMYIFGLGFAAATPMTIYFDGVQIAGSTTDVNGFSVSISTVPDLPNSDIFGTTFHVIGSAGGITAETQFTIDATNLILDSAGFLLDGEYAVSGSMVTVYSDSNQPFQPMDVKDTGFHGPGGSSLALNYYYGTVSLNIISGSFDPVAIAFDAAANGTLILQYALHPSSFSSLTTGTVKTISIVQLPSTPVYSDTYKEVGAAQGTWSAASYMPASAVGVSFTNLVPFGSTVTPETVGYTGFFGISIASTPSTGAPVTFTSYIPPQAYFTANNLGHSPSLTFANPEATDGVYVANVYGAALSTGGGSAASESVYTNYEFIVSAPGSSTGTIVVNQYVTGVVGGTGTASDPFLLYPDGLGYIYGLEFDLYGFPAGATVYISYYDSYGLTYHYDNVVTDVNGAGAYFLDAPYAVGGITYNIHWAASSVTITGANWYYQTIPAVSYIPTPFLDNGGAPVTDYYYWYAEQLIAGSSVGISVNSLAPSANYGVWLSTSTTLGSNLLTSFETWGSGDRGLSTPISVTIPFATTAGTYYLDVAPLDSGPTATTSLYLTVEVAANNLAAAFPGQWVDVGPITVTPPADTAYYQVQVQLNGTTYTSLDTPIFACGLTSCIQFGFTMPNDLPGAYWYLGYTLTPMVVTSSTVTTTNYQTVAGTPSPTGFTGLTANTNTYETVTLTTDLSTASPPIATADLAAVTVVQLTATTGSSQVDSWSWITSGTDLFITAQLTVNSGGGTTVTLEGNAQVNVAVTSSSTVTTLVPGTSSTFTMSDPTVLLQGNGALLTGISPSQIATIVAAVNASVTDSMQVPLADLNASVVAINGAVAEITTSFGAMNATLAAINASVTAVANGVAVVQTTLGTVTAALSAIGATLVAVQATTLEINTTVGMINTTLDGVQASLVGISNGVMSLSSDVGNLTVAVGTVDATLNTVAGNVVSIKTTMGTVEASLASLNTTIQTVSSGVNSLLGSMVTVKTDLGTIQGQITALSGQSANQTATITTGIGNLQTSVNNIASSQPSQGSINTVTYLLYVVIALIVITLAIAAVAMLRAGGGGGRVPPAKPYEAPSSRSPSEEPKSP